ncbi:hypothetical protein DNK57_03110 [Methanothermobacter thermautotrophicus]|jgi:hypothetical protein|uniref:C2H2-type domain-containing protein n=1 Tax=Methanothermobacter thermautotrophicus TaxID=145262 RepID=A0A842YPD4_METTF|nr:hypothetical protein [Methanothermobacter thermautotrophicus]MBE2899813.1 hypothetical protein [Methanothermobacter thermautotrophicus]MCQ8905336.1 hypothetical protein [Methanothermobacter sp.]
MVGKKSSVRENMEPDHENPGSADQSEGSRIDNPCIEEISDDNKIEECFICHKKFNINADDSSHYHYGKYPMCSYCSDFYGFYR